MRVLESLLGELDGEQLTDRIQLGEPLFIYGAGTAGRETAAFLNNRGIKIAAFIDGNSEKQGCLIDTVPVHSPQWLSTVPDSSWIWVCSQWADDIMLALEHSVRCGFADGGWLRQYARHFDPALMRESRDAIREAYALWSDERSRLQFLSLLEYRSHRYFWLSRPLMSDYPQYHHPLVMPVRGDRVVDGGAFSGDTSVMFADHLAGEGQVIAFEPAEANFKALCEVASRILPTGVIAPVHAGLWSGRMRQYMDTSGVGHSYRVTDKGNERVELVALDDHFNDIGQHPTLIKLDIEGAEREALLGATGLLGEHRPKLQISLYHRHDDLWELPLLIDRLSDGGYRFFLGHHHSDRHVRHQVLETVLYATPKRA